MRSVSQAKLDHASSVVLGQCLKVRKGEKVLIVANSETFRIAEALYAKAAEMGAEPCLLLYPAGIINGEEPPEQVAKAMLQADVVVAPTVTSISHTDARRKVSKKGKTRISTLPGITEEVFVRGMSADYRYIKKLTRKLHRYLDKAKMVHVTSPSGTDLTLDIRNRAEISDGDISKPGAFSNLPDGETELAPVSADGMLVIDRCGDIITEPTKVTLVKGRATTIQSNASGRRFKKMFADTKKADGHENGRFVAEFAIGTNPTAKVTGCVLEDEKVLGTCHIAFGDNTSYPGGKNRSALHMDVIVVKPTITLDGKKIMERGKLLV
jgi:aminopeptidase